MKNLARKLSLLLSLCCLSPAVKSQTYTPIIHRYGTADGMSDREVNIFLQDKQGFFWIGTRKGLNRFDGKNFRIWTNDDWPGVSTAMPFIQDANNYIWLENTGVSILLLDPISLKFHTVEEVYGAAFSETLKKTWFTVQTKDSTIYLFNKRGYSWWHPGRGMREKTFQAVREDSTFNFAINFISPAKTFWGITKDPKGYRVTELDSNGVILYQSDYAHEFRYIPTGRSPEGEVNYYLEINSTTNCLQVFPDNAVRKLTVTELFPGLKNDDPFTNFTLMDKGNVASQYYQFYDKNGRFFSMLGMFEGLGEQPRGLFLDKKDRLWTGSRFGLIMTELRKNRFRKLLYSNNKEQRKCSCRSILEKDGHLFVCSESGIFRDEALFYGEGKEVLTPYFGIEADPQGGLFIGEAGLIKQFSTVPGVPSKVLMSTSYPWTLYLDRNQRLWIGQFNGLAIYDIRQQKSIPFTQYNGFTELAGVNVLYIHPDHDGNMWVCASTGIYLLDLEKGIQARYWTGGDANHRLPFDNIAHYYEDNEGVFWLGTLGGGLIRWDRKNNSAIQYSKKNGFHNNTIYAVYEDKRHHLWMPSDEGIIQFDKNLGIVRHVYLEADGTTAYEFNRTSHYQGSDGTLYFGSLNGITAFNPNDFYDETTDAPSTLAITQFMQFDRDSGYVVDRTGEVAASNEIIYGYGDRFFDLDFALLSLDRIDQIKYFYKIDGVDVDWNLLQQPHLRMSLLPYGKYYLHIKAVDANGLWAVNELNILLNVQRPFWTAWWFYLLCALLLSGLIYAWFQYRLQQALKLERMRVQISSDLHDDVGSLLAGLAMQAETLETTARGKDKSKLHKISELSRSAMTNMRDTVWVIDARKDKLENLIDRMREHAEETLTPRDIRFDIQVENLPLKKVLPAKIRQNLYLIYKEAVTNAAKHSNGDRVWISLKHSGKYFELCIRDNGSFAAKNYTSGGLGLSNLEMRAKNLGGWIEIDRENGFSVTLFVPEALV